MQELFSPNKDFFCFFLWTSNQIGESIEKSSGRKLIFVIGCSDNWRKMATKIIKVFFDNIKRP